MSTSRHIDRICVVVTILAVLLTVLFINGKAIGIASTADPGTGDDRFTANDLGADWDTAGATYITLNGDGGGVKGNGAYVYDGDVYIVYAGKYIISGELTDGSVIVDADGDDKIWILLNGVSLHCDDSAAIVVEQAGKVFLTVADGTENFVSSGESYSEDAVSSKIDGTIYSRDDLTINGSGSLSVTAAYKHGIVCNDDIVIVGANIEITAPQDGIHANDSGRFADMDLTINAGDDGLTVKNDDETSYIYIESGNINITSCYEGIEAIDITIAGGKIDIRPTDDGINACGQGSNSVIRITGGDITIINETGRDADGLDSNGDILISGGNTFISVNTSSYALDYGSENGGVCKISGGKVIAAGGSAMAEGFDSSSEQGFIMYNTPTAAAGTALTLKNAAGDTLISKTIPCAFSSVVISTPEMRLGETCTISVGGSSEEITVDNSSGSGGFGMGGMQGGGMFGGRGSGGRRDIDGTETADRWPRDMTGLPAGGMQPMEISEPADGTAGRGELPQTPGDGFLRGENDRGGDQFTQWEQNRDRAQGGTAAEASGVSPDALILTGVSALILLAGILIAFKVKH